MAEVEADLELIQEGTGFLLLEEDADREPVQSRQAKIQSSVVEGNSTATTVATSGGSTPPVRPKTNIYSLAAETVISILEFLRATDLCAVSETDKTVFSSTRIKLAISYQLNFLYPLLERQNSGGGGGGSSSNGGTPIKSTGSSGSLGSTCSTTPTSSYSPTTAHGSYLHSYFLEQQIQQQAPSPGTSPSTTTSGGLSSGTRAASPSPRHPIDEAAHAALSPLYHTSPQPHQQHRFSMLGMGIDLLYVREIKSIIAALSSPQPVSGKMYWISTSWVANAKKYYEALALPEININTTEGRRCAKAGQNKRIAKIRVRRGSDALPPWPQMNSELVCHHGRLSLAKTPKGKRRLISASAWHLLRKFYPSGPAFPAGPAPKGTPECALCSRETDEAKQVQVEQREKELSRRTELLPTELLSLFSRKSGVPTELLVRRRAAFIENADAAPARTGLGAARSEGIAIPQPSSSSSPPPPSQPPRQASPVPNGRPPLARSGSFSLSPFSDSGAGGGQRLSLSARSSLASLDSLDLDEEDDDESYEDDGLFEYYEGAAAAAGGGGEGGAPLRQQRQQQQQLQQQQNYHHPLVPGIYHLVPRSWVRKWRHYNKDPSSSSTSVPPIDCTSLLCHSHGLCVVPPHLEEYLLCVRKTLLGGLGQYPGEVVEVISLEEWEALHSQLKSFPDFSVRFSLGPEGDVAWNVGICQACDPFNYGNTISSPQRRRK